MPCVPHGGRGTAVRIVLDTNVVLSALLWHGTPYRLLEVARRREQVALFTRAALVEELAEVLVRRSAAKRIVAIGRNAPQVLADYVDAADLVTLLAVPSVIAADPDDDQVIAAAVAAQADLIVSGNRHLLALSTHQTVRSVTPAEAVARIGG